MPPQVGAVQRTTRTGQPRMRDSLPARSSLQEMFDKQAITRAVLVLFLIYIFMLYSTVK